MGKQDSCDFFKENSELFKQNYSIAVKLADANALHDLRVSIKRISALLKMLNYRKVSNFRLKKCHPSLNFIFKTAAPVRDFQVLEELIIAYQTYPDLKNDAFTISTEILKIQAIKDFFFYTKKFNYFEIIRIFRIIENYLNQINEEELYNQMSNFRMNHFKLLIEFSNSESKKYNLHKARKVIKEICYLMEMSKIESDNDKDRFQVYKEAGRCLGDWHDRLVLQEFLNQRISQKESDIVNLERFMEHVANDKINFKEQYYSILDKIDQFRMIH